MSNVTAVSSSPKGRRRWLKVLACLFGGLVVLIVVAYFVLTSSAFFKGSILPRVSKAINASVTVSDASIHPFSEVVLHDLKVQPEGQAPLVTAPEIRVRYHLWDIIGGNIHVDEVALTSPTIELVENPDGSRNLDPILKALQTKPSAAPAPETKPTATTAAKPLQIDVGKVTLANATVRQIKNHDASHRDLTELNNINVTLTNLKNGQTAKLDLAAGIHLDQNPTNGATGTLAAAFKGNFDCALTSDLKPDSASGSLDFTVAQAAGAFADFEAFGTSLKCDVTPSNIKQLAIQFQKAGSPLGELAVSGPFGAAKSEGTLNVDLHGIDRRLLNLVGAKSGIDFNTTTVNASTKIELAKGGSAITATGKFEAGKFQVTRAGQTTPTLDLNISYDVAVDRAAQNATLRSFTLAGAQNGASLLSAQLDSPMVLAWGSSAGNVGDAAFNLAVNQLNLADWKPFLGSNAPSGVVGVKLKISSHEAGKQITFDLNTDVANLSLPLGSNQLSQIQVNVSAQGQAAQFKQITLSAFKVDVAPQNQLALSLSGSGTYDVATQDADLQVKLQTTLARLLQMLPQPGMQISSGAMGLDGHITQKQKTQTVTGQLTVDDFDGVVGKNQFRHYSGKFDVDVANSPEQIQVNKFAGSFSQNGITGGSFEISATTKTAGKSVDANIKFTDLNANALRPFVEPALNGKTLVSVSIGGNLAAQYRPDGASSVKGDVQVANLVVKDPSGQIPATPLAVGFQIDAALDKQVANINQFQIALTPTARATNQLRFSGSIDLSNTNATQGNLKISSDSMDLTRYYDLFAGATNTPAKPAAATQTAAAPAAPAVKSEPEPVKLPLQNFTLGVALGRFYLHDLAITNLETTLKIDGGHVVIKPLSLNVNGGPITASVDVDLGVRGYKYNVAFDARTVPIAPFVSAFQPSRAGQMGGTFTASAQVNGAGITDPSIQKNLAAQFVLGVTNLNLSIAQVKNPMLKLIVNVVAVVPELLSGQAINAAASLLSGVTGQGGLTKELEQSPLQVISMQANVASGKVNLQQSSVQSAVFQAEATGDITLNQVLTNSTIHLPVELYLSQSAARKLALAGNSTNAYVALPHLLTMNGTLGNPKPDKTALLGGTARTAVQVISSLASTNSPVRGAAEKLLGSNSPAGNLLNQFFKPK